MPNTFSFDFCQKKKRPKRKKKTRVLKPSPFYDGRRRSKESLINEEFTTTHLLTTTFLGIPFPMDEPNLDLRYSTYEEIVDSGGGLQNRWNPVDHVKWDGSKISRPSQMHSGAGVLVAEDIPLVVDPYEYVHAYIPSPSPTRINELSQAAERHFKTIVKPEVMLANFVLELVSFLHGASAAVEAGMKKAGQKGRKTYARKFAEYIREGYSKPEAHFLALMFALLPFIEDVKKILCSAEAAIRKFNWLVKHNGKAVELQFNIDNVHELSPSEQFQRVSNLGSYAFGGWDPMSPPWEGGFDPLRDDAVEEIWVEYQKYTLKYHAEATVVFCIPEYKLRDGGVFLVWESMMSLDRLFAAIWEAIPFSFIVDWFTNSAKDLVHWLDDSLFKAWPDAILLRVDHSFKVEAKCLFYVWNPFTATKGEELGVGDYTRYQRAHGLPEGKPSVFASPHNLVTRSALGVALGIQQVKRLKPHLLRFLIRRAAKIDELAENIGR